MPLALLDDQRLLENESACKKLSAVFVALSLPRRSFTEERVSLPRRFCTRLVRRSTRSRDQCWPPSISSPRQIQPSSPRKPSKPPIAITQVLVYGLRPSGARLRRRRSALGPNFGVDLCVPTSPIIFALNRQQGRPNDSPSLYRWSPFGALMYIQPRSPPQAAHCRSATVCLPVLLLARTPWNS